MKLASKLPLLLIACLPLSLHAQLGGLPPRPAHAVKPAVQPGAALFDLADVRLLESEFKQAMETDKSYLLWTDPDRFLVFFQKQAGLFQGTDLLLGWGSKNMGAEVAQWSLGHYLSACSEMYRSTGDEKMLERVNYIIDELAKCQQVEGNAGLFLNAKEKKAYEDIAAGTVRAKGGAVLNDCFVPLYGLHIMLTGLVDAYDLCGNAKAKQIVVRMTDWYEAAFRNLDDTKMQALLAVEHGGMAEALAAVYAFTGEPRHLAFAKKFRHDEFFKPLSSGEDNLDTRHANTQVPKFTGYQLIHELIGDADWGKAAENFWERVALHRSFANGGNCVREHFNPLDKFDLAMKETQGPETCNSYNMLRLTRRLYEQKAETAKMDYYERVLYNHILPTQHPQAGGFVYNTPLLPGAYRVYMDVNNHFWCCVGTGMENHALYGAGIYAHSGDKLLVNLFIPSQLTWRQQDATITQTTRFPDEPRTTFSLKLKEPKKFTVAIRYPRWLEAGAMKVAVNGKPVQSDAKPGDYLEVTNQWKDGDSINVELPMRLRTEMLPNTTSHAALFYGPILLGAKLGRQGLEDTDFRGSTSMPAKGKLPLAKVPMIVVPAEQILSRVEQVPGRSLKFVTRELCKPADVTLVPIQRIHDERYSVYFPLTTPEAWTEQEKLWTLQEQEERDLAALTIDEVRAGEQQPERDHNILSDKSNTPTNYGTGRPSRDAKAGGWFSYELKADPKASLQLRCLYWGSDKGPREMDILVDGNLIASQVIDENKPGEFFEVAYPIPAQLSRGKNVLTVKFQAKKNQMAPRVYNVRILRNPGIAKTAKLSASVTSSNTANFKLAAVNDLATPKSSGDTSASVWHTFNNPGKPFWLQYDFPAPTEVSAVEVFWFDESATKSNCRVPASWKLMAKVNGQWKEVEKPTAYGVAADKFNRSEFKPSKAEAVRIDGVAQPTWSTGVLEWKVE